MKFCLYLIIGVLIGSPILKTNAQTPRIPEASFNSDHNTGFGLGKVTVTYSRPNVKGRVIFGGIIHTARFGVQALMLLLPLLLVKSDSGRS